MRLDLAFQTLEKKTRGREKKKPRFTVASGGLNRDGKISASN